MMPFDWDLGKAAANEIKHGVSFREAATVFGDPLAIFLPDEEHSIREQRLIIIGVSVRNRLMVVSHVERGSMIRIISARLPTNQERKSYEEDKR